MSRRHKFSTLRERIDRDPERRRRMDEKREAYDALLELTDLAALRRSHGVTQAELADRLGVSQPNVSKIEAAAAASVDPGSGKNAALQVMQLSTLAHYVGALGGRLEVRATFPEHPENNVAVGIPTAETVGGKE